MRCRNHVMFACTKVAVEKGPNVGSRFNRWSVFNDHLGPNLMVNIDPGHFSTLIIDRGQYLMLHRFNFMPIIYILTNMLYKYAKFADDIVVNAEWKKRLAS